MRKIVPFVATILLATSLMSCTKTQNCHCDYVGRNNTSYAGQTKSEDTKVSNKVAVDAYGQCSNLEEKYFENFDGTCTLQ